VITRTCLTAHARGLYHTDCSLLAQSLRQLLAEPERTDEELAVEEVGGDVLVLIGASAWRVIAAVPGLPAFLLDTAERGGRAAVLAVLARHGIEPGPSP
jgi:hypothetical protein